MTVLTPCSSNQLLAVPLNTMREAPANTASIVTVPLAWLRLKSPVVVIGPPLIVGLPVPKTMVFR